MALKQIVPFSGREVYCWAVKNAQGMVLDVMLTVSDSEYYTEEEIDNEAMRELGFIPGCPVSLNGFVIEEITYAEFRRLSPELQALDPYHPELVRLACQRENIRVVQKAARKNARRKNLIKQKLYKELRDRHQKGEITAEERTRLWKEGIA